MGWYLDRSVDYEKHNEECRRVWDAYEKGTPYRVPVTIRGSIRNLFENPAINETGHTFDDFFQDPEAQIRAQLAYQTYVRHNLICDLEMGPPEKGWDL